MAKKIKEEVRKINWFWLLLLLLGAILLMGITFYRQATKAEAKEPHKQWVCHCEPRKGCESLFIDDHAFDDHLEKHDDDYAGECKAKVDGLCGKDLNSCEAGTFKDKDDSEKEYKWYCEGENGGKKIECKMDIPQCNELTYTCGECSDKPNDDWCGEWKYDYCTEKYGCHYEEGELKTLNGGSKWVCDCPVEPTPTPSPTPTPEPRKEDPKPEGCTSNCGVPACTDRVPKEVANPHIYRKGDCAIVKWYPTEGDKANIYWKENSSNGWQHAVSNIANTGSYEVCGLGTMDITFGVQSVNGCAADGIVNASNLSVVVDGATGGWVLFR